MQPDPAAENAVPTQVPARSSFHVKLKSN
jgi:hypothetical protein